MVAFGLKTKKTAITGKSSSASRKTTKIKQTTTPVEEITAKQGALSRCRW
jgi:hypothetical protein